MKGISIKDIAKQAGVSPTTVSFVLNGKGREKRISEQVSKKILKLAAKLKYKPNQLARGLRTGKTKTIGLIVEDIANHFFASGGRSG
ncbi:LacI family DNA-binding transcriptional regulator [Chitinophaga sp.]|uniref:LacI family DNA-binding transcriptional regulator n=1 Tax=Chitinophaga sp. TaxID=1869181 RepID=UPI0026328FED|nr:LacI family DNA-binding transcriptional regulator [uncultured Chitinophaga sp.]